MSDASSMTTGAQGSTSWLTSSSPPSKKIRVSQEVPSFQQEQSLSVKSSGSSTMSQQNSSGQKAANGKSSNVTNGDGAGAGHLYDHNLYSRQIYALGESAMTYLRQSNILVSGMGSVGVEIAKNLILGGVRHVTIHDTKNTTWRDLSAQFYLSEENIGSNRAASCFAKLEELNDSVQCALSTLPLTEDTIKDFDLVVLTDSPFDEQLRINSWTRKHKKRFISADARGLFTYVFEDLGEQFRIDDHNGETCKEIIIEHVNGETGDVFTLEEAKHDFEDDDYVLFSEVKGMEELNEIQPVKIKVIKPNIFNIGEVAKEFNRYTEGGRARQVKVPRFVDFKSLPEELASPDLLIWDFAKFDQPAKLHSLWQALYKYEAKYHRSPRPRNVEDAELLKKLLPEGSPEIPDELIHSFSFQSTGNLQPIASVVGGIAAQEAMKAVTHHTMPLQQFLYMDFLEALPGDYTSLCPEKLTPENFHPRNNRYDGQAAVFGWPFQEALSKQKWFVVGAGAIGCELLKNMAMIGLGCGTGGGHLKITDMDTIEISNLNRQFLFRRHDVGKKKSEIAAKAVKSFNPTMNIEALSTRVAEDTEEIFTDKFFSGLSGVANALDNVNARRYMDRRCVYYELPLLESGTMGGKGNTQVIYPHLTESYSSSNDPPEKETPVCTLKNFPYEIQHTIQWGREKFSDLFTSPAETANQYIEDVKGFLERLKQMNASQQIDMLVAVKKALVDDRSSSPEECIAWGRGLFEHYYHNEIKQLIHTLPADHVNDQGVKFWSGTKRYPHPLTFDANNENHLDFVYAASILHAQQYNIEPITSRARVAELAQAFKPVPFEPRTGVKIAVTDAEASEQQSSQQDGMDEDTDLVINKLNVSLARLKVSGLKPLVAIDFEKDDDSNHHVEFVAATSNLRAENYDIPLADKMKTKQIAGKIIPALATTTAAIAGLAMVELYKMIDTDGRHAATPIDRFKNGFVNLALPFFAFSEPIAAPVKKYGETSFTLWDRIDINAPKTLKQVIDFIKDKTGLEVSMMSAGVSLLYAFFMPPAKANERLNKDVVEAIEEVSRKEFPRHRRAAVLEVMTQDEEDEDVEIPFIKYNI